MAFWRGFLTCIIGLLMVLATVMGALSYTAPDYTNVTLSLGISYVAPSYQNVTLSLGTGVVVVVADTVNVSWTDLPPGNLSFHNITVDFSYIVNYTNSSDVPVCEFYNATDTLLATNSTPPNNTITTFSYSISGEERTDSFYISCADSITNKNTTHKNITLDDTLPVMGDYSPVNSSSFEINTVIVVNMSVTDTYLKQLEINITDSSGVLRYHLLNTSIVGPLAFEINESVDTSGWASGLVTMMKIISDGNSSTTFNTLNNTTYFNIVDTVPPNMTRSTYDVVNAYVNSTVWSTDTSNVVGLNNSLPIVNFTITESGNCSISVNNSNYTDMVNIDPDTQCGTTNSLKQECVLPSTEQLLFGDNDIYISCIDSSFNEFENSSSGPLRLNLDNIVLDFNITITQGLVFNFTPVNYTADNVSPTNQNGSVGLFTANNNYTSNIDIHARLNETNVNITLKIGNGSNYSLAISINTSYQIIYLTLVPNATVYLWAWADYDNPDSTWYPKLQIKGSI